MATVQSRPTIAASGKKTAASNRKTASTTASKKGIIPSSRKTTAKKATASSAAPKATPTKPSINPRYKDIEKYLGVVSGPTDLSTKKLSAK